MVHSYNEQLDNVFSIAGIETANAFGLLNNGLDFVTSMFEMEKNGEIFAIRLTGGADMVGGHLANMFAPDDSKRGRVLIRDVKVETNIGKIDALVVDAIDYESGYHVQLLYPYQPKDSESELRIHRLKMTKISNMNDSEKRTTMDQFFDGFESVDHFNNLNERSTDISVDFA